ncbi:MFS transporter [Paenibacillus sp. N1-5-1-14]|uniref:MFS transporter n=1 Tax=Paenibacillus radicibacter TaxID=2972488 RepID=UPI0021594215|nr:MFS transporter [Paenibacillus radicibacter]MCR8644312.1 MFS transporter [Paenibacillus radicibacter]
MSQITDDSYTSQSHPAWVQRYLDSPHKLKQLYRRTLAVVVLSQIFGGAGLAAGVTIGALLAKDMLGSDQFAGIPVALMTFGSAISSLLVGRISQKLGRRYGLSLGFIAGGIGAIGVIFAAILSNVYLLFAALLLYGAGTSTNLQARYAGTDLASPTQRATAVSIALVSTTFGAVAGPNLVQVMGNLADSIGIPTLAGPFILSAAAFIGAGIVLFILLRPDPLIVSKAIAAANKNKSQADSTQTSSLTSDSNKRGIIVGATIMILTQIVMVSIMSMTPVHMGHHGHGLGDVGLVIGFHVGAMYLPSLITGILVDKIGRTAMAIAAGVTLLAAGILSALAPVDSLPLLIVALSLLGLGWNFGLISGTTLIVDATTPATRAKTQGTVDVFIALSGASSGLLSGVVFAYTSYPTLSLIGGFLSLLLVPVVVWSIMKRKAQQRNDVSM